MTFTGTTNAWLTNNCSTFNDLTDLIWAEENNRAVTILGYSNTDMSSLGWVQVGVATITVALISAADVTGAQMIALVAELQATRAENQQLENAILERISKLQALTYEVVTA